MKIKKQTSRRICIFLSVLLGAFIFAPMCFAAEFTGLPEIDNIFNQLFSLLFGILRAVGAVLVIYGLFQFAQSFQAHDTTARISGILMIAGGLIVCFLREILIFLGITV